MRTEQPQVIYLKDYQAPEYLIDETHLTFELFEDHTLVHAQLVMRRNPARGAGLPPLELDGQQLELLRGFGCDQVQGYLISKALPLNELARFLVFGMRQPLFGLHNG